MNIEDIKVGETYNVRVKVVKNDFGDTCEIATVTVDENGKEIDGEIAYYTEADAASFAPIIPETAPKYDPCRFFKVGDTVSPKSWHDRMPWGDSNTNRAHLYNRWKCTVIADEYQGIVKCKTGSGFIFETAPCFLDLITPVEELEPYNVFFEGRFVHVRKGEQVIASFNLNAHPNAKEAAEAECARLNAEHRKENA